MAEFPNFYNPERIGTLFNPDAGKIAREAARANLSAAARDEEKIHLLIVDMQVDFCHQNGSLFVPGALEDIRKLIEFIFRHAERITGITCSLDSHYPVQIFHAAWWADTEGNHPQPFTIISHRDVKEGKWQPLKEPNWSVDYVRKLEEQAKKELVIWPYHVPIGGVGSALDPELWSSVFWHSIARSTQPNWWTKGSIPKSEHYSVFQPEISVPDHPQGQKAQQLLDMLTEQDHVIIAGEAASHCVLETIEDLVIEYEDRPEMLKRCFVLEDCTSPVEHPEVDFGAMAREKFAEFEKAGVNFLKSTDPLPF